MRSPEKRMRLGVAYGSKRLEIGVLYGFRALMVLLVANYHIWQQSWLEQSVTLFGQKIGFDYITRSSYLFVDGMILLSGFLLYLPYARQLQEGTPVPGIKRFYLNRLKRILPSYGAAVLLCLFCIAIPEKQFASTGGMVWDVTAHLTFTQMLWPQTYLHTPLNVALWTITVEMQFYLLFPLLARCAQKRPGLTAGLMCMVAWTYRLLVWRGAQQPAALINQLPAFLDVYALGMLGAAAFVRMRALMNSFGNRQRAVISGLCLAVFAAAGWLVTVLLRLQSGVSAQGYDALQRNQLVIRLPLAVSLLCMMLAAAFMPRHLQKCLDNRLMRFLSVISMNLYIWHQVLAVQMRKAWFADANVLHGDAGLQQAYTLLCFSVAVLAAMAFTYGLEQPAARWMERVAARLAGKGRRS